MKVAVLTAIYDSYDSLKELPAQDVEVDAICVTDDPDLTSDTWRVLYEPRPGVHPNRAAKPPKCCPWRYTNATFTVWVDASFQVQSSSFVSDMFELADPVAQFVHPDRDCIYDEARFSMGMGKYAGEPLDAQIARYGAEQHPAHWGLWATGVIAMRHTIPVLRAGEAWLAEIDEFSFQDQVSQAPTLRRHGLRPGEIPGGFRGLGNPWLAYEASGRH